MSNFDMKQLVHITAEVVVIGSVTYFLHRKNTFLQNKLIETQTKILEQEKRIENLENQLSQIGNMVQMLSMGSCPMIPQSPQSPMQIQPPIIPQISVQPQKIPVQNSVSIPIQRTKTKNNVKKSPSSVEDEESISGVGLKIPNQQLTMENMEMFFRGPNNQQSIGKSSAKSDDDVDSIDEELHSELAELEENNS